MRYPRFSVAILAGAALLCPLTVAAADADATFVEDEVIVQFRPGLPLASLRSTVAATQPGAVIRKTAVTKSGTVALARFPKGTATVAQILERYQSSSDVVYAEPNYIVSLPPSQAASSVHPNNVLRMRAGTDEQGQPTFYQDQRGTAQSLKGYMPVDDPTINQWGWYYADASVVWKAQDGCPWVAIVDTGADYSHPDLRGMVTWGPDLVNDDKDPMDDNGHGTMLAGLVSATINNQIGISGVSNGRVYVVKALNYAGKGTAFDVAQGIRSAALSQARAILVSFTTPQESVTLRDAVRFATITYGKLIVAAAGDDHTTTPVYPAAYSTWDTAKGDPYTFVNRVLAVGAQGETVTTSSGDPATAFVEYCQAPYSNYGSWVNIVAPGTDIYSTTPYKRDFFNTRNGDTMNGYNAHNGTAFAAAYVAGIAVRAWSAMPELNGAQMGQRLLGTLLNSHSLEATTGAVDVDGDGTNEMQNCWDPTWATGGTRTAPLIEANAALAMGRSAVWWHVRDGSTGQPLTNIFGIILQFQDLTTKRYTNKMPIGSDRIIALHARWSSEAYAVRLWLDGYTNGPVSVDTVRLTYRKIWHQLRDISVPQAYLNNVSIVADWGYGDSTPPVDLDLHLMFPTSGSGRCDVGASPPLTTNPAFDCGVGNMHAAPYTRLVSESKTSGASVETIQIRQPIYSTAVTPYRVFIRDFNEGRDISDFNRGWPIVRTWIGGMAQTWLRFGHNTKVQGGPHTGVDLTGEPCTFNGGTADCSIWYVADMKLRGALLPVDQLGDGATQAVLPFGGSMTQAGTDPRPGTTSTTR
jgi:hypothetical protein